MFCPKCGASNADGSPTCTACGAELAVPSPAFAGTPTPPPAPMPPNYLILGILTTIFCCIPAGIVSIVFAAQVSSKYASGDYAGAVDSSNKAKTWGEVAALVGLLVIVAAIVFPILVAVRQHSAGLHPTPPPFR
jgi:hypothetical protein